MRTMLGRRVDRRRAEGHSGPGRKRMPNDATSPYATYLSHLQKGELAYQFSPAANRAVFFPRVLCPYTGSDKLEWRVSKGRGTVYATTIVHPAEGAPFNVALIDCRRRLPPDEPRRGCGAGCREDRHAGEIPRAQAGRRGMIRSPCSPRRPRDGRPEARRGGDRRGRRIRSRPGRRRHEPDGSRGAGHAARARRLRADAEGCRRPVLRHDAGAHVDRADDRVSRHRSRNSSARR